jgi:hypothetical protein
LMIAKIRTATSKKQVVTLTLSEARGKGLLVINR